MYAFAAKGGSNGEPHNHNDLGHFILYGAGEVWCSTSAAASTRRSISAKDGMAMIATAPGDTRADYRRPLPARGARIAAVVLEAVNGEAVDRLALELTSAYRVPALRAFTRTLEWNKKGNRPELTLRDRFTFDSPRRVWWSGSSPGSAELVLMDGRQVVRLRAPGTYEQAEAGGSEVVQALNDRPGMLIHYDSGLVEPELTSHVFRDHFGQESSWYAVDFKVKTPGLHANIDFRFQFI